MKENILKLAFSVTFLVFIAACDTDLLVERPPHIITSETLFTTLDGFETGLNGLYAQVRREKESSIGDHMMMGSMFMTGTDNSVTNHQNPGFYVVAELWREQNNPNHTEIDMVFKWLYGVINAANTIINQAEARDDVNWSGGGASEADNRNRVMAEARALRAWAYRHLTYGWSDVPLSLEESSGGNVKTDWERTPVAKVREQIIEDLLFAEAHVGVEPSLKGRITKGAVQHLLSEMYLVMKNPGEALKYANKVIETPNYKLITQRYGVRTNRPGVPFMDMFWEGNTNREDGNTEALWVFQFGLKITGGGGSVLRRYHLSRFWNISVGGVRPIVHTYERGGLGYGRASFTKWALDIYEPQDDRFSEHAIRKFFILGDAQMNSPYPADNLPPGWSYGDTLKLSWSQDITPTRKGVLNWPFSRKAEGVDPSNMNEYFMHKDLTYIRLAETYLLKAEAELLLGRPQDAANTINIIRRRSNASEVPASAITIDFILDERSRELFLEEHRRWTLLRTGKWLERTRAFNKNGGQWIAEKDLLYPIPQSVIDANLTKEMPQNPGF
jgi:starch-binding outer membrane protein, SusD/RagB family